MRANPRILMISHGEFSGVTPALEAALRRAGCEVIKKEQSLRELGLRRFVYGVWVKLAARWVYGKQAQLMEERTRASYVARSAVSRALVDRHPGVDIVLLIAANSDSYRGPRPPNTRFVIYTDYMNLISKSLPDYGFALYERNTYPEWNRLERQALLSQDRVFVMGSHVKPEIESRYDIAPEKLVVVGAGPGLDLDIERAGRRKDWNRRSILFVGKLAEVKGLGVVLQAFEKVREVFPDAVLHVVTGKPVSAPGVVFHGKLDSQGLADLFYDNPIFTMPAYKEPLGLVYLEAMWAGMACIGTRTGSMPEIIRDGETGYIVEPGDPAALAERIVAMLRDPARTKLMGERGYAAAKSYWHWDGVVQRMLGALN
jgi:glycosyltransferase involved in cell wall biosynthesis